MRIVILYNEPLDPADAAEQDVLVQRDTVAAALAARGHAVHSLGATLDLDAARQALQRYQPDVVFNLVESLGGTDRLMPLATLLLEGLGLPFTGCGTAALLANASKVAAKQTLRAAGLPTADWITVSESCQTTNAPGRWIVKPTSEHASVGMDDDSVIDAAAVAIAQECILQRSARSGRPHFAERYIDGREFNLSLLTQADGTPQVLPPAEIDFSAFPAGKPRIVGHAAKWDADSFEFQQTPRTFHFAPVEAPLLQELRDLAVRCWQLFNLRGYARVDFRVDAERRPWILEINPNPCLSPDAGFAAALQESGVSFGEAIERIVAAARVHRCSPVA